MGELETVATERLEAEILAGAARSTAAMYRWLCHVAEFDRRDVARSWGFVSTAAWLAWRCGLGSRTARDQVSVARRLQYLPNIAAAMASGSLSYTKVRALCRVATPANERDVLDLAVAFTAAQLEEVLRRYKAVDDTGSPVPDPEPADPSSIGFAWNDYGRLDVRADLSAPRWSDGDRVVTGRGGGDHARGARGRHRGTVAALWVQRRSRGGWVVARAMQRRFRGTNRGSP